jgi:hypothetical protein
MTFIAWSLIVAANLAACAVPIAGAAQTLEVRHLPNIVVDGPRAPVNIATGFTINVKADYATPSLRVRLFRGTIRDVVRLALDGVKPGECMDYDSALLPFRSVGGRLEFPRVDQTWLDRNGGNQTYVVLFERDDTPQTNVVRVLRELARNYFANGFEIIWSTGGAAVNADTIGKHIEARNEAMRRQAAEARCIVALRAQSDSITLAYATECAVPRHADDAHSGNG